jgi:hypothetical protein
MAEPSPREQHQQGNKGGDHVMKKEFHVHDKFFRNIVV